MGSCFNKKQKMVKRLKDQKIKRSNLLFFLPFILLIFFSCRLSTSSADSLLTVSDPRPYWHSFFSEALDGSNLDVRDAGNRPIRSYESRSVLKGLFTFSVFRLLVQENLPIVSSIRRYLEEKLTPFREQFQQAKKWFIRVIELAVLFNFKRFLEILALFCLLFFLSSTPSGIYNSQFAMPQRQVSEEATIFHPQLLILPLRC